MKKNLLFLWIKWWCYVLDFLLNQWGFHTLYFLCPFTWKTRILNLLVCILFVSRNEYKIGNRVRLNVVTTGASAAQNKHPPVEQYVSRKNEVAYRGSKIELYCIYGGT